VILDCFSVCARTLHSCTHAGNLQPAPSPEPRLHLSTHTHLHVHTAPRHADCCAVLLSAAQGQRRPPRSYI
jgi:hypothetical protein